MKILRIVVVDDSPLIRDYLHTILAGIEGCEVVGMAADGNEALTLIHSVQPELVVLDISMPHRNGIEVLREIRKQDPHTIIVMFTADPSTTLERICIEEGANHYVSKTEMYELIDICKALQERVCPSLREGTLNKGGGQGAPPIEV